MPSLAAACAAGVPLPTKRTIAPEEVSSVSTSRLPRYPARSSTCLKRNWPSGLRSESSIRRTLPPRESSVTSMRYGESLESDPSPTSSGAATNGGSSGVSGPALSPVPSPELGSVTSPSVEVESPSDPSSVPDGSPSPFSWASRFGGACGGLRIGSRAIQESRTTDESRMKVMARRSTSSSVQRGPSRARIQTPHSDERVQDWLGGTSPGDAGSGDVVSKQSARLAESPPPLRIKAADSRPSPQRVETAGPSTPIAERGGA